MPKESCHSICKNKEAKGISRNKKNHFIMITGPNHWEDVIIINFKTHKINCTIVKPDRIKIRNRQIHRLEKEILRYFTHKVIEQDKHW